MRKLICGMATLLLLTGAAWSETVFQWDEDTQIEDGVVWMALDSATAKSTTAGLAWRVQDPENYYLALYSGDDGLLAIFTVLGGEPEVLRIKEAPLKKGKNLIEIRYAGDIISAYLNEKRIMVVKDATIGGTGGIGWIADTATQKKPPSLRIAEWEPKSKKIVVVDEDIEWETVESYDSSYIDKVSEETVVEYSEEWSTEEETIYTEESDEIEVFESVDEYESYESFEDEYYEEESYEESDEEEAIDEEVMEEDEEEAFDEDSEDAEDEEVFEDDAGDEDESFDEDAGDEDESFDEDAGDEDSGDDGGEE